jgi:hypothetical protein
LIPLIIGLAANSFIQKREAPRYRSAFAGNTTAWRLNVKLSKEILAHNTPASYRYSKGVRGLHMPRKEGVRHIMSASCCKRG